MKNKNSDSELNELIRASMKLEDTPPTQLNNRLKASLYQRETAMQQTVPTHAIPLWFVPMILNFVTFSLFAVLALLTITNPYLSKLVAGICAYISVAGIMITTIGIKRTNMKEDIAVRVQKRGVPA